METQLNRNRRSVLAAMASSLLLSSSRTVATENAKELVVDHVMFPVYFNNEFVEMIEQDWKAREVGKVFSAPQNPSFKPVYYQSRSFYIEYLSTVKAEPYWSNAVYLVVDKKYWDFYKSPALVNEHFLIPQFGCGYQLVSPEFPHLNSKISGKLSYDGFILLISQALSDQLTQIAGQRWSLPSHGKVRVHAGLKHVHDMAVIDDQGRIIAPKYQANPLLREFL